MKDLCLLCAQNRTRRWVRRNWAAVPAGMLGAGASLMAATWHDFTGAVSGIWWAGLVTAMAGVGGLLVWVAGWDPPAHPGRALWQLARRCEWGLVAAAFLLTDVLVSTAVIICAGGWHT